MVLSCGHVMCEACVTRWRGQDNTTGPCKCPVCCQPVHQAMFYRCYALAKAVAVLHPQAKSAPYRMDLSAGTMTGDSLAQVARAQEQAIVDRAVEAMVTRCKEASAKGGCSLLLSTDNMRAVAPYWTAIREQLRRLHFDAVVLRDDTVPLSNSGAWRHLIIWGRDTPAASS